MRSVFAPINSATEILKVFHMIQEIVDFCEHVGKLKRIRRKGWVSWAKLKRPESVADHSFRSAILAMCLSDLKGLDTEKMVRMALLHDVHEALIGDYDYFDKNKIGQDDVTKREEKAINTIFSALPEVIREKYLLLADEYRRQETEDAKLIRQVDRIEMIMQALEYEKEGDDETRLQAFWDSVREKLKDRDLKMMFELLEKERTLEQGKFTKDDRTIKPSSDFCGD
jgi:putative hydrolase of HD superfamily